MNHPCKTDSGNIKGCVHCEFLLEEECPNVMLGADPNRNRNRRNALKKEILRNTKNMNLPKEYPK